MKWQAGFMEAGMHRVTDCKASEDYRFWLRFEYCVEGSVFLGNFLEIGSFRA